MLPDFGPLVYLAVIGMIATALFVFVGIPMAIWWLFNHVQIV